MRWVLIIIGFSFVVIIPLLLPGFILTHDMYFPLFRLYGIEQCFNEGQIPPRWVSSFALGYGYPFFNFYAPLAYYIAYLLYLAGLGYVYSIHATVILGFLLGGIGVYFWVKEILHNNLAGLVAAIVYVYFPYHLVQVYVRGDISEFIATAFFPWVLFFFYKLWQGNTKFTPWYLLSASLSYAAVILSHNIMAMVFTAFLLVYIIFLIFTKGKKFLTPTTYCLLGLLFGLGFSAYFWLPALAEKQFVSVENLVTAADYRNHFVSLVDLVNPRWGWGGSEPGAINRMSLQLGLAPILLSCISLFFILNNAKLDLSLVKKQWYWFSWISLLGLIFLMLPISKFIWAVIPLMKYILYPWRLLALTALPLTLLSGATIDIIRTKYISPKLSAMIALIITILLSSIYLHHRSIPVRETELTPEFIWTCESVQKSYGTTMSNEYLPQTVNRMPNSFADSPISTIAGKMVIQPQTITGTNRSWFIIAESPSVVRLNTFYFPGWQVELDGTKYAFETDSYGLMLIAISSGNHQINQVFTQTSIRKISHCVSIFSLITFFLVAIILFSTIKPKC
ncbi:MAG: 6-pyruvoyl-tetrahydropterin synthase-related protein [bacterium]|nr:6-pyruvoyl-tetrahydropterin synthase-related protein [bacterium]